MLKQLFKEGTQLFVDDPMLSAQPRKMILALCENSTCRESPYMDIRATDCVCKCTMWQHRGTSEGEATIHAYRGEDIVKDAVRKLCGKRQ
jgi:hypothetical protein